MPLSTVRPLLEPLVADEVPADEAVTDYDRDHLVTYLRLIDAAQANADWEEVARVVLRLDLERDREGARRSWESHLARARWLSCGGYLDLLH